MTLGIDENGPNTLGGDEFQRALSCGARPDRSWTVEVFSALFFVFFNYNHYDTTTTNLAAFAESATVLLKKGACTPTSWWLLNLDNTYCSLQRDVFINHVNPNACMSHLCSLIITTARGSRKKRAVYRVQL